MADFERLIDVNLKIQHLEEEAVLTNGFKSYLFETNNIVLFMYYQ